MRKFLDLTFDVVSDLHRAGFTTDAEELQRLADIALDEAKVAQRRNDALKKIETLCHVKWLGDLFLTHLLQNEWWGKIEKLGKSAKRQRQSIS